MEDDMKLVAFVNRMKMVNSIFLIYQQVTIKLG